MISIHELHWSLVLLLTIATTERKRRLENLVTSAEALPRRREYESKARQDPSPVQKDQISTHTKGGQVLLRPQQSRLTFSPFKNEKINCKSTYLTHQLLIFFPPCSQKPNDQVRSPITLMYSSNIYFDSVNPNPNEPCNLLIK